MNTIDLIRKRVSTSSKRQNRADPFHISLVFECGGMRGVAAGGAAMALQASGLGNCFDSIHGSSAGACAGAYFLTQQSDLGTSIFTDVISDAKYVHPWRLFSRPAMVDVEKIVMDVIKHEKTLDVGRILAEPDVLKIITTNIQTGKPVVLSNFKNSAEIYSALRASLTIPGINEPGVLLGDGSWHFDGGISAPIPLFSALLSGATHVVIIATSRRKDVEGSETRRVPTPEYFLLRFRYGKRVAEAFVNSLSALGDSSCHPSNVHVDLISRPNDSPYCNRFTVDRNVLRQVRDDSYKAAMKFCSKVSRPWETIR